jgi:multidrug efflux pump subunit AcrB
VFLIRLALGNPYLVVVAMIAVTLFGSLSLTSLPVDIFPDLRQPVVMLFYSYRGMPARDMERNIVTRMERLLTQAPYLDHLESRSLTGVGLIKVFFRPEADANASASFVANLAASVQSRMPPGTQPPIVMTVDPAGVPVCQLVVSSETLDDTALLDLSRTALRPQLGGIPGVAALPAFGGKDRQIMVYVDRDALAAKGLSPMDVVRAIDVSNLVLPAGDAQIGDKDYQISSNAQLPTAKDFGSIPIKVVNGAPVYVRDVAVAEDSAAIQTSIVRVNGRRMIYIPIQRQAGANAIAVVDGVRAVIPNLKGLPPDVKVEVAFDQSQVIRGAVEGLLHEGLIGGGLACLMVLVFLANLRSTAVITLAIPVSILAAFIGLAFTGNTVNIMTLGGLALSVGTLVDNSIVVLENIVRHLGMGKSPRDAAGDGAAEVVQPVSVATLCNLAVYLPVLFLAGIGKYLFIPLAVAVFFAMTASLVASLTVVPAYCALFLTADAHLHGPPKTFAQRLQHLSEHTVERLAAFYAARLRPWLAPGKRLAFAMLCLGLFLGALSVFPLIGREFFPAVDSGQFTLHIRTPAGTRLSKTEKYVAGIEGRIREICGEDLQVVVSNVGLPTDWGAMSNPNSGPDTAFIQVNLKEGVHTSTREYVDRLRADLAARFPEVRRLFQTGGIVGAVLNGGLRAGIDIQVEGSRLAETEELARRVRDAVADIEGVREAMLVQNTETPQVRIEVDRAKAAETGLTADDVMRNLITAVNSSVNFSRTLWIDPSSGDGYYVGVQYRERDIDGFEDLEGVPVLPGRGGASQSPVLLENLATVRRETTTTEVVHYGIRRVFDIHLEIGGRDVGSVGADIDARLAALREKLDGKTLRDHPIAQRGEVAAMNKSFAGLGGGLALAVATLYLIMVAQYRSFVDPLLVLFAVPMGLAGVLWTLYLTGTTLNIQSYIGTLMMIGICVANSIMLVDFANHLLAEGLAPAEAALRAGQTRLRPIIMTALASTLGLAPMAVGGKGHEANAPLARAVIGGLLCSTIFTLFLVPVLYTLLKRSVPPTPKDGDAETSPAPAPGSGQSLASAAH